MDRLRIFHETSLLLACDKKTEKVDLTTQDVLISYSQRHYPAPKADQCISQPEEILLSL